MEFYGDLMYRLDIKVSSPDGRIRGRLHQNRFDIKFKGNAYREYTEDAMASQIAAVCQLLWVGHRKASLVATARVLGDDAAEAESHPSGVAERELFAKRQRLEIGATSPDGRLSISCVGFQKWRATIKRGTFDQLSEDEFRAAAREMAAPLMADYQRKLRPLLDEYHRRVDPESYRRVKDMERHG